MTAVLVNVDFGGTDLRGQPVNVYATGTQNAVTIYDPRDGVTPLPNPIPLYANGHVVFAVAPGTYDLVGRDRTRTVTAVDPNVAPVRGNTLTSPAGHVFALSVDDTGHIVTTQLS